MIFHKDRLLADVFFSKIRKDIAKFVVCCSRDYGVITYLIFQLSDVTMTEHDPETGNSKATSSELKTLLEKYPLRVSYQDGHIEHLCLAAPENVAIINIKRGILSVFQNNMDDITKNQKVSEVRIEPDHAIISQSLW